MDLVILRRDGVVNQKGKKGIYSPEDWHPIPGSLEAIARLNHAGYKVAIATEQPGLITRELDLERLNAIHARFHQLLSRVGGHVDAIFICPHGPDESMDCKEARPGLYQNICERFFLSTLGVPVISDDVGDLQAAKAIGGKPILVGATEEETDTEFPGYDDLSHAVEHLLTHSP